MRATTRIRWGVLGSAFLAAVACHDQPVTSPTPDSMLGPSAAKKDGGTTASKDTVVTEFTIEPGRKKSVVLGDHKLYVGDNITCDPKTTPYGPEYWDAPCQLATEPVTISAKHWIDKATGRPIVEFKPDLRFAPTNKRDKMVTLTIKDSHASLVEGSTILYCPKIGEPCIDEAATDPSVATTLDPTNGFLTRRLKHFSGYNVAIGRSVE